MDVAFGLLLLAVLLTGAHSVAPGCLEVSSSADDTSTASVRVIKADHDVESLCPGVTYGVVLAFPEARTYQLISTKGAFKNADAGCANRVARKAASPAGAESLYLGCAATGVLTINMVSAGPTGTHMLRRVNKPIKALADCPASPCNIPAASSSTSASSGPANTAGSSSPTGSTTIINLSGDPMADLQTLWALMTGVATAPPFKLPTLDPATAFQMITIMNNFKDKPLNAANTLSALQSLLHLVPADADPTGLIAASDKLLSLMAPFLIASPIPGSTSRTSASVVDMLSTWTSLMPNAGRSGAAAASTGPGAAPAASSSAASASASLGSEAAAAAGAPADILSMINSLGTVLNSLQPSA